METCAACKYEVEREWDSGVRLFVKGDEDFLNIEGSFHRESEHRDGGSYTKKVYIHACPKCGTLKIGDFF